MRRDALERREKLIAVAAEMFEGEGYDVPLEAIAERAGIGRGTLYRNFKDRSALILAVMRLRLGDLAAELERNQDDLNAFFYFLGHASLLSALHARGRHSLENDPTIAGEWAKLQQDAEAVCRIALERGQATGRIRADLTLDDVATLARMLEAPLVDRPAEDREAILTRAITFLIEGIGIGEAGRQA